MNPRPWKTESSRTYFGQALVELGARRSDIVVVGADTTQSLKTALFGKKFPDRLFNIGIAEQNMMGVAAGLAAAGKVAFACTYSVFGTAQVYNIIRQSIAYPSLPVKIFCSHAGLTVGPDGATHQMNEDISLLRSLPNMKVVVPCDGPEVAKAVDEAADIPGPLYCRFSRARFPTITSPDDPFEIGKATVMREGEDLTFIAVGIMVSRALEAAEELEKQGVRSRVINMSTVKPLDIEAVLKAAKDTGGIVTGEEHTMYGGLGSAVAEVVAQNYPIPIKIIGVPDTFGESGEGFELLEKYGLTAQKMLKAAMDVIRRKEVMA
ncbi:MAG: transketolase C-terminal domain-containing protein [Thermoplasmata archaeon]